MLGYVDGYFDALAQRQTPGFSLRNIEGFPYSEYQNNLSRYTELWNWYSGTVLDAMSLQGNENGTNEIELYPVRVNPIVAAAYKHVYALFGEISINDRPPVYPRVTPSSKKKTSKETARHTEDTLYRTWWENNSFSMMVQAAIQSQIYGGCIFRLRWDMANLMRTIPIAIENIHPANFVGIPDSNDAWSLSEAWFIRVINYHEMLKYADIERTDDDLYWLVEHVTRNKIEITINGKPARYKLNSDVVLDAVSINPFGVVPAVYIPHLRAVGFYGESMIDNLKGIVKELNLRVADYGDAVNSDSHTVLGMRNVQGTPQLLQLARNLYVLNLQGLPAITGTTSDPDLFDFRKPSASDAMGKLYSMLYDQFRRDAYLPAIADGEDEGSQRSGLTLAMRMWPLVSHTNIERLFWTDGLNMLNRMILRMLYIKNECGIKDEHVSLCLRQQWYPPLPRDREQQVNEAVQRIGANLGSPEHLIEMLGDVEDPAEEIRNILKFLEQKAKIESEARASTSPEKETGSSTSEKKHTEEKDEGEVNG